jgi:hypothetical protein
MRSSRRRMAMLVLAGLIACSAWAGPLYQKAQQQKKPPAQQKGQPQQGQTAQPQPPPPPPPEPEPMFGGTVTLKTSRQTSQAASAGFNGLDPNGAVLKTSMDSTPGSKDSSAALRLSVYALPSAELQKFIEEGHLNAAVGAKPAAR